MRRIYSFLPLISLALIFTLCSDNKETKTEEKVVQPGNENTGRDISTDLPALSAPDFTDPELKQYYATYTTYMKKVVSSIQNKDEAGTMKLFNEEGGQFSNKMEMDQKAQTAEREKFNSWLMQTMPYQKIIVESDYYKKFNEEYYKKLKEKNKEKGY